jgi:hypothetical protein
MTIEHAGQHAGAAFATDGDFAAAVSAFAAQGLERGGQVVIFPGPRTLAATTTALQSFVVRPGQLAIIPGYPVQLATGRFDPEHLTVAYQAAVDAAIGAGYTGLWVAVDMGWASDADPAALIAFESTSHPLFDGRLSAMCLYDGAVFPADVLHGVYAAHPSTLDGCCFRYRRTGGTLWLSGETDRSNAIAFGVITADLAAGAAVVDLTGMAFLDVDAGRRIARILAGDPAIVARVTPMGERLLSAFGADAAQVVAV